MPQEKEVSIEKWVEEVQEKVLTFVKFWKENVRKTSEYPNKLATGDWDEQFEVFVNT